MQGYSSHELSSASLIYTETQTECPCRPSLGVNKLKWQILVTRGPPNRQTIAGVWSVRREFVFYAFVIMQKQPRDYHCQQFNITKTSESLDSVDV